MKKIFRTYDTPPRFIITFYLYVFRGGKLIKIPSTGRKSLFYIFFVNLNIINLIFFKVQKHNIRLNINLIRSLFDVSLSKRSGWVVYQRFRGLLTNLLLSSNHILFFLMMLENSINLVRNYSDWNYYESNIFLKNHDFGFIVN